MDAEWNGNGQHLFRCTLLRPLDKFEIQKSKFETSTELETGRNSKVLGSVVAGSASPFLRGEICRNATSASLRVRH
jgi:hypothetical protein